MNQHFARIGAMVNGRTPFDAKVAAENAAVRAFAGETRFYIAERI